MVISHLKDFFTKFDTFCTICKLKNRFSDSNVTTLIAINLSSIYGLSWDVFFKRLINFLSNLLGTVPRIFSCDSINAVIISRSSLPKSPRPVFFRSSAILLNFWNSLGDIWLWSIFKYALNLPCRMTSKA